MMKTGKYLTTEEVADYVSQGAAAPMSRRPG